MREIDERVIDGGVEGVERAVTAGDDVDDGARQPVAGIAVGIDREVLISMFTPSPMQAARASSSSGTWAVRRTSSSTQSAATDRARRNAETVFSG